METLESVRQLVSATLDLGARGMSLGADSALLGSLPELDSLAVMSVVATLEGRFDIEFEDEDITARNFATLGSLAALVERKAAERMYSA